MLFRRTEMLCDVIVGDRRFYVRNQDKYAWARKELVFPCRHATKICAAKELQSSLAVTRVNGNEIKLVVGTYLYDTLGTIFQGPETASGC